MEEHMKHIDDLFKEELGGYAEMPPPPAWGALEKRLEEDKKRRAFPYRWFWVVGLIAFVAISGYGVANKLAGERMLASAAPVPASVPTQIPAGSTNNNSSAPSQKERIETSAIAKTTNATATIITHHKKHAKHIAHITDRPTVTKTDFTPAPVEALPATVKTTHASQYPSEEDVYEGAVASTAPIAYESTTQSGYTVNRRKKHNMVVADMSPVTEEQKHYASAAESTKSVDAPAANTTVVAETIQPTRKTSPLSVTHTATPIKAAAAKSTTQPKPHMIKSTAMPAMATLALASATPKIKTATTHIAKASTTTAAANTTPSAKQVSATQPQIQKVTTNKKVSTAAATNSTEAKSTPAVALANTAATSENQADRKPATKIQAKAAAKESANMHIVAATPAPTRSVVRAKASPLPINTTTQDANAHKKEAKVSSIATNDKTATLEAPVQPTASGKAVTKAIIETPTTAKPAAPKQAGTNAPSASGATIASSKQSNILGALPSIAHKESTKKKSKAIAATIATTAKTTSAVESNKESEAAAAKVPGTETKPGIEETALKTPAKLIPPPCAKATKAATTTTQGTSGKSTASKQKTNKPVPMLLAAKAIVPKVSKNQPAYRFTPSIEDDAPEATIDNLRTESTVAAAGDASTPIPGTFKASASEKKDALTAQQEKKEELQLGDSTQAGKHNRFEAGIKAGFEGSIMTGAANKFVISPYLDYKLSSKFSILLQPAIKSSMLATHNLAGTQSYYNAHPGDSTLINSAPTLMYNNATHTWDTLFTISKYQYRQSHDSIVKSYNVGGTYFEFELPILLKYAINEKLSVYGGVNIAYSRMVRINEKTFNSGPITLIDSQAVVSPKGQYVAPPTIAATFTYSGQPLSNYAGPLYPASSEGLFRLGYMLGFSYEFKKRWMLDALVQQGFAKSNVQGGYNTNTALALPYMRLTLGYRLTK